MSGPREVSAAEIADAIVQSRARLARTLAVLDREYALRHLFVRGTRMIRHNTDLGAGALPKAMRSDILPLALIGLGLAWLALGGRREGAQLGRRLIDGLAHLQELARDLIAVAAAPPGESADHAESSAPAPPNRAAP